MTAPPFAHQRDDTTRLLAHGKLANFSEPGTGKSRVAIDAACTWFTTGKIQTMLVVCPASVRSVWTDDDPEFGQLMKFATVPMVVSEYARHNPRVPAETDRRLTVGVTNYEFIRRPLHLAALKIWLRGQNFFLVVDESSFIKNHRALQTKAVRALSQMARYTMILNGTPGHYADLYSQFDVLDPHILNMPNFYVFRARHAIMGGFKQKQIVGYRDTDTLNQKMAPYIAVHKKSECLDLPDKLYTTLDVPLDPPTWKIYQDMKKDLVAWLDAATPSIASQAGVKMLRLSQVTGGFLGGVTSLDGENLEPVQAVGSEKRNTVVEWLNANTDDKSPVLVWCRFRHERVALHHAILADTARAVVGIYGGQSVSDRAFAIRAVRTMENMVCLGQPHAGGWGLNLQAAHTVIYYSNDYSLIARVQSEDRVHRSGQRHPVTYIDLLASGPAGHKTIDHAIVKALRAKQNVADWQAAEWKKILEQA